MRALAITYEAEAGPGVFGEAFEAAGADLDVWLRTADPEPSQDPAGYDAVLSFGGAMHIDQEDEHRWLTDDQGLLGRLAREGVPVLGVCLGAQILTKGLGGEVRRMERPEIGWFEVEPTDQAASDPLLGPLAPGFTGFGWHSYECLLPGGAVELARSASCLQAYRHGDSAWAIQFHPEVTLRDAESWIRDYRKDEDAAAIDLDIDALGEETRARIGAWNELGRELCGRFLEAVS